MSTFPRSNVLSSGDRLLWRLKWIEARTRETLQEAIGSALLMVSVQDAQGWFRHCGYLPAEAV
ncbi:MAG TPA: hypothetical protein VF458_13565 [Ktedonobacteraceae bacterium]